MRQASMMVETTTAWVDPADDLSWARVPSAVCSPWFERTGYGACVSTNLVGLDVCTEVGIPL